jgi:DNA repair exonuclease SbcCD ATPase subunit
MTQKTLQCARAIASATLALGMVLLAPGAHAQQLDAVLGAQAAANQAAEASQEKINKLSDETTDLATKYRRLLSDADSIKRYTAELGKQVGAQNEELESLRQQLADIETVQRDVYPLMEKMVASLEQFVALDIPFLLQERTDRVNKLKDMMAKDFTVSEKYRRIMEAYSIEMEYGRTLDAYEGTIGEGDAQKAVQFVRLGRISLMYQTLDGKSTGYWDSDKKAWVEDNSYARDVKEALGVAQKKGAPDLLLVPVHAPTEVQS